MHCQNIVERMSGNLDLYNIRLYENAVADVQS